MSSLAFKGKVLGSQIIVEPLLPIMNEMGEISHVPYCRVIAVGPDVKSKAIKEGVVVQRRAETVPGRTGSEYIFYPKDLNRANCHYLQEGSLLAVFDRQGEEELITGLKSEQAEELARIEEMKLGDKTEKKEGQAHTRIIGEA